jgi:hypothetical protein
LASDDRQLAAKRERLEELRRADVGVSAQVLKPLMGKVVLENRHVEGQGRPHMVARFKIKAVLALAMLNRRAAAPKAGYRCGRACKPGVVELHSYGGFLKWLLRRNTYLQTSMA